MPEAVIYYAGWNIYFSGLRPLVFLTPESVEHGMEDVEDKDGYLKKQIKNIYIFFFLGKNFVSPLSIRGYMRKLQRNFGSPNYSSNAVP